MSKALEGKVAIVTGSGQGVGRALAMKYAEEGAMVITNNRKPGMSKTYQVSDEELKTIDPEKRAELEKRREMLSGDAATTAAAIKAAGGKAEPFFCDISDYDAAKELVDFAVKTYGKLDIVANIAGAFGFGSITQIDEKTWDRVTGVKPKGHFNVIHWAAPYMIEQKWGRIINCTSRAWLGDWILHPEYCAANAGVVGLTRAVAIELYKYNITCNAFSPFAATRASVDLEEAGMMTSDKKTSARANGLPKIPFEMTPSPESIAPFLTYLCTDEAANISGAVFSLAGNSIGRYSDPDICAQVVKYSPEMWTVDELKQQMPRGLFNNYVSLADPSKEC